MIRLGQNGPAAQSHAARGRHGRLSCCCCCPSLACAAARRDARLVLLALHSSLLELGELFGGDAADFFVVASLLGQLACLFV